MYVNVETQMSYTVS